jgi:hypothetical protein
MGNSYWPKACPAQAARTPSQLQQANFGGNIFAVSIACERFVVLLLSRAASLAVGLTCDADSFIRSCCAVQRDVGGWRVRGGSWDC